MLPNRMLTIGGILLLAGAPALSGQEVTIGGPATEVNSFPFAFYDRNGPLPNRYQQVYASTAFSPGAIFIDAIRFHAHSATDAISSGEYLIRLSTTSATSDALSSDFDANLGFRTEEFFSGMFTGGGLRIVGSPYLFDPFVGNLLLDVLVISQATGIAGFQASNSPGDAVSRLYIGGGGLPTRDTRGLVTTFEFRPADMPSTTVPEPVSVLLLGTGLAGLTAVRRRRNWLQGS